MQKSWIISTVFEIQVKYSVSFPEIQHFSATTLTFQKKEIRLKVLFGTKPDFLSLTDSFFEWWWILSKTLKSLPGCGPIHMMTVCLLSSSLLSALSPVHQPSLIPRSPNAEVLLDELGRQSSWLNSVWLFASLLSCRFTGGRAPPVPAVFEEMFEMHRGISGSQMSAACC